MSTTSESPSTNPYVGLRPFDLDDSEDFFGRDRDARLLRLKIISAPLTLLYARSGLGKTSLLRVLTIPDLEKHENCRVIYLDAWSGEQPEKSLYDAIASVAADSGIADPTAGDPTLSELVRLALSADDRTIVLVLDQFEEFLVNHAGRLDPLRKQLASLVRSRDLNVRVVLALREEFLAALEPFREEILTLFQSTYRLEPLTPEGARDAIEQPATKRGAAFEEALVDRLLIDLSGRDAAADPNEVGAAPTSSAIDLPMLQLVCSRLWNEAGAHHGSGAGLGHYESVEGIDGILVRYIESIMPRDRRSKLVSARILLPLAPASGLKQASSATDLADQTGLDEKLISTELKRLEEHRILRSREFRQSKLFELQHDQLIGIVRPWARDVVERDARRRRTRKRLWVAVPVFAVSVALAGFYLWALQRELAEKASEATQAQQELTIVENIVQDTVKNLKDNLGDDQAVAAAVAAAVVEAKASHSKSLQAQHVKDELDHGNETIEAGQRGPRVRRVQEWLFYYEFGSGLDANFGPATAEDVRAFQRNLGMEPTGAVDLLTWDALVAPMQRAMAPIESEGRSLSELIAAYARQHIDQHPMEVGSNSGPWVRLYCEGNDGPEWEWEACFVSFVMRQAASTLGVDPPIRGSVSNDSLALQARSAGLFVSKDQVMSGDEKLSPGSIFLTRRTPTDWTHTGIVLSSPDRKRDFSFETAEGNTNDEGAREGYEAVYRLRGLEHNDYDFIVFPDVVQVQCGAVNMRPCKLWERIPSCESGLKEDFATNRCVP